MASFLTAEKLLDVIETPAVLHLRALVEPLFEIAVGPGKVPKLQLLALVVWMVHKAINRLERF